LVFCRELAPGAAAAFVIASEAKQSSFAAQRKKLDCFVASLLAMTVENFSR
jgi:hypothetical protein